MDEIKYKIRVIRGAFINPAMLDKLGAITIKDLGRDEWQSIDEVTVTLTQIKQLQKGMVKHYDDPTVPWYLDGYKADDKNQMLVVFGADDGEGGKIFIFERSDKDEETKVIKYGISKGIPAKQMGFGQVDF